MDDADWRAQQDRKALEAHLTAAQQMITDLRRRTAQAKAAGLITGEVARHIALGDPIPGVTDELDRISIADGGMP